MPGIAYALVDTQIGWYSCAYGSGDGPRARVYIEAYEAAVHPERGAPVRLKGSVEVVESGWSLTLPFDVSALCEYEDLAI